MEKVKEKLNSKINIYSRDIHSVTSPPAKLCYILIVYVKSRDQSADQSRMTSHSITEKEQETQWLDGQTFLIIYYFFFQQMVSFFNILSQLQK